MTDELKFAAVIRDKAVKEDARPVLNVMLVDATNAHHAKSRLKICAKNSGWQLVDESAVYMFAELPAEYASLPRVECPSKTLPPGYILEG